MGVPRHDDAKDTAKHRSERTATRLRSKQTRKQWHERAHGFPLITLQIRRRLQQRGHADARHGKIPRTHGVRQIIYVPNSRVTRTRCRYWNVPPFSLMETLLANQRRRRRSAACTPSAADAGQRRSQLNVPPIHPAQKHQVGNQPPPAGPAAQKNSLSARVVAHRRDSSPRRWFVTAFKRSRRPGTSGTFHAVAPIAISGLPWRNFSACARRASTATARERPAQILSFLNLLAGAAQNRLGTMARGAQAGR